MRHCAAVLSFAITLGLGANALAEAPIALEKWGRYHVNITPFYGNIYAKRVAWRPKVQLVFKVTSPETDDVVELQHYRGKRKWGPVQKCAITASNIVARRDKSGKALGYSLVVPTCLAPEKLATQKTGAFSVKVSYKQTGMGKVHRDLATYHYRVKRFNAGWASRKGPIKAYYIDHDFRMGEAWAYLSNNGQLQLWSWFKYGRDSALVRGGRMRCFVNGKKLAFYDHPTGRTEIAYDHYSGNNKHAKTTWGLWYWWTARVDGKTGVEWLKDNPGDYRCTLTQNGEIARELFFSVQADGTLKKPPCQPDQVRSLADEPLIRTSFKKNPDKAFDRRAFSRGAFYGRKLPAGCP